MANRHLLPLVLVFFMFAYRDAHSFRKQEIVFDDSPGLGRRFDGIGAISGGGATSKLLVNYEKKYRDEVLDYLYKPNFGASLQIFKVEIGGDMQSTDGTEASHMHNSWDENYHRGYEWFLMKEIKKRNPDVKLYGLPWGFPGWLGQSSSPSDNPNSSPYDHPNRTADYVVRWVKAAKTVHNLTIDYVGIWNEREYNVTYIKTLRRQLDEAGLDQTMVIAPDSLYHSWKIADDILKDKELAKAVYAIGAHYTGTTSSSDAKKTKKILWASEDFDTFNDAVGGGCWARILNQNYVNGYMTSTVAWNLVASYYYGLQYYRTGLMTAMEPWSGHYDVNTPVWVTAHTTQFVPVGWTYLNHSSGVGHLPQGGSYVSLTNEARDQLTIVLETMSHDHSKCIRPKLPQYNVTSQTVTIKLKGSYADLKQLNVWYSKLGFDGKPSTMFQEKSPLVLKNGQVDLELGVDEIYTLTTVKTGHKGTYPDPPASHPFPDKLYDDFSAYAEFEEPNYLAPQVGSLEIRRVNGEKVARQTVLQQPVYWCDAEKLGKPISIVGDYNWTDMGIEVEFEIPEVNGTDGVFVAVRVDQGGCRANKAKGIFFFVFPSDDKYIVAGDLARHNVIDQGSIRSKPGRRQIALTFYESVATGSLDNKQLFQLNVTESPKSGWAAVGADSFGHADFYRYQLTKL